MDKDKPNRDNTITVKINGESQNFEEENLEQQTKADTKVIKLDPDYAEQEGSLETAAAKESADESFDWIIPESSDNDIVEYKVVSTKNTNNNSKQKPSFTILSTKRNGNAIKSFLITAIFAVLIGTSFGVLMLKLVMVDTSKPAVTEPVVVDQGTTGKGSEEAPSGKTTTAVIEAQTAFIVQGGAFSTKDAAKDAASQATKKSVPAQTLAMNDSEFLFLGVADSIETAKQLSGHYKTNGYEDSFAKQIPIAEKNVDNLTEGEKSFLEAAPAVFQQLSKITASAIVSSSISADGVKELETKLSGATIKNEKVKDLQTELSKAIGKVKAYQSSKSKKDLTQAQQHLLNFLTGYYSL